MKESFQRRVSAHTSKVACLSVGEALFEDRYLPQLGRVAIIKNVLFAARDEAWRIPAFLLTQRVSYRTRTYTEQLERMQSELLGYTAEEIDAWCDHQFR